MNQKKPYQFLMDDELREKFISKLTPMPNLKKDRKCLVKAARYPTEANKVGKNGMTVMMI
ncbi:hypothetical protein [Aureispira sp. CCB-E]|uniref:hypothetical protein n=1 Tax=Aureispira sp. CCB-E TaxID=3051121 RepID=UPI00286957A7|nr:hypothetical protein [Aureispira sp. CCB-E]WMX17275.1 hypothetical protein QP953_12920 [Aureispira sp. CCB-E]